MYWVIVGFISDQFYQYLGVSETKRIEYAMVMAGLGLLYTFVLGLVALEVRRLGCDEIERWWEGCVAG